MTLSALRPASVIRPAALTLAVTCAALLSPAASESATLRFTASDLAVTEPDGTANLTVELSLDAPECGGGGRVSLRESAATLRLSDGTATGGTAPGSGADFLSLETSLPLGVTGPAPILYRSVAGAVFGDEVLETDETFFVNIELPAGLDAQCLDADGTSTPLSVNAGPPLRVTILDDDGGLPPIARVEDADDVVEGDAGTTGATFRVSLEERIERQTSIVIGFRTVDGDARAGEDYDVVDGTVTFPPGLSEAFLTVQVRGDTLDEVDETFFFEITSTDAEIAVGRAQATILDDDEPVVLPTLSIANVRGPEGGEGTSTRFDFPVTLSAPAPGPVSVAWSTVDGNARAGEDYEAASGTLVFETGQARATIPVVVLGDVQDEDDERFFVELSAPQGATLGNARGRGTIVDDDEPAEPTLQISDAEVEEGAGNLVFRITLDRARPRDVQVDYAVVDGTAIRGADYGGPASGVLRITAGATAASLEIPVADDAEMESTETLTIRLSNPDGVVLGRAEATGTITDDDGAAVVRAVGASNQVANTGDNRPLVVVVRDANGIPVPGVEVAWLVLAGDATLENGARRHVKTSEIDDPANGLVAGRSTNLLRLGPTPGPVQVVAQVTTRAGSVEQASFTVTSSALSETSASLGEALVDICDEANKADADDEVALNALCAELTEIDDPGQQEQALREFSPEEVEAFSESTFDTQRSQLRVLGARLAALRSAAETTSRQLALNLGGVRVNDEMLASLARPRRDAVADLASTLDALLTNAQHDDDTPPETQPSAEAGAAANAAEAEAAALGSRLGFHIEGAIGGGNQPTTSRETGFELDLESLTTGIDYRLNNRLNLGVALSYGRSDVDLDDSTGFRAEGSGRRGDELDAESFALSLYAGYYRDNGFYLDAVASFGVSDYTLTRQVDLSKLSGSARGTPDGDQLGLSLAAGYSGQWGAWSVTGFGRLDYVDATVDAFRESGDITVILDFEEQSFESLLGSVGIQASYAASFRWGVLLPTVRASLLHEYEDDSRPIEYRLVNDPGRNLVAAPTDAPDRDFFNAGLGFSAVFKRGKQAFLFYEKDLDRSDLNNYRISLGLRFEL